MQIINLAKLQENIDLRMKRDLAEGNIIGAAARVYQDNCLIYDGKYGVTELGSDKTVKEDTVYRLASMTKPITAVAILILKERGLLKLEDLVENYLPEYKELHIAMLTEEGQVVYTECPKKKVSIFHLLTHSSGIGCGKIGDVFLQSMTKEDNETLEKAVRYYAKTGLAFEPFTTGAYSAVAGFDILARIVEVVSKQDFQHFVQENICIPLEMRDTTFTPTQEQWSRMIQMHNKNNGKACVHEMIKDCVFGNTPTTHYLGGAGMVSTISDYMNFAIMLLNEGKFNDRQILAAETVKEMVTPYIYMDAPPYNQKWGLGVRVITGEDYGLLPIGAFGWSGAYGTHFFVDPVNRIAAVYMKNSVYDGGSGARTAKNFEEDIFNALE